MVKNSFGLTQGPIFSKLMMLSLPVVTGQFLNITYTLSDIFWLGMLSPAAVAASGTASLFVWLGAAIQLFLRAGTEIGVSQSFGKGDSGAAQGYTEAAFRLAIIAGIGFGAFLIFARVPLVAFFGIPDEQVVQDTQQLLVLSAITLPFIYMSSVIAASFQAYGNTRTPFINIAAGVLVNVVLDPILIFGAGLGVMGAAYATIAARLVEFALHFMAIRRSGVRPFERMRFLAPIELNKLVNIFKWGWPIGLENALFTILSMVIAMLIAGHGVGAMAAQRVAFQIESLSWLIGLSFGIAVTAFVGQNYGAGMYSRIHRAFKLSLGIMSLYGIVVGAVFFVFAYPLMAIFLTDEPAISMGASLLRFSAFVAVPSCFEASVAGCFRGQGRTFPPSFVNIGVNIVRAFLAHYLNQAMGLDGIWIAVAAAVGLRGLLILLWFLWEKRKLPMEDVAEIVN